MASRNFITNQFRHKQFSGILSKWTPLNGCFLILHKMLEKHPWNSFLLYLLAKNLQLLHEIAVSWRYSIKEVFWKTSQNSEINTRSIHSEVFCDLCQSLFFNKVAGWNLKLSRGSHWRCSVKKLANFTGNTLCWSLFLNKVAVLGACNFI